MTLDSNLNSQEEIKSAKIGKSVGKNKELYKYIFLFNSLISLKIRLYKMIIVTFCC